MAMPGDLLARIERYQLISKFFPDWVWGALFFVLGALVLLPVPKVMQRHTHWLLCALWLGMVVLSVLASLAPPALLIASLCFFVAMVHAGKFWRLSHPPVVRA